MKKILCILGAIIAITLTVALAGCTEDKNFVGEWECVSLTEFADTQQETYPVPAETCMLVVKNDGTFKATGRYGGNNYDLVEGNWEQNGDSITVSNVHFGEEIAHDEESRLTIIFTDKDHITLKIEVEYEFSVEGSSYNLKRK